MLLLLYDHVFFRNESVIYSFQLQSLVSSLSDYLSLSKPFPLHLFICVHLIFLVLKIWYFFTDNEDEIKQLRDEVGELRRELKDLRGKWQTDLASRLLSRVSRVSRASLRTPELHEKISPVMIKQIKIVHNNLMD